MATITEDYVSFELAKLLKEKGFDLCTYAYYEDEDNPNISFRASKAINWNETEFISEPTLQMVMKWLREVHSIHIIVNPYTDKEGQHWHFIFDKYAYGCWQELAIYIIDSWDSYEEACEIAIKYCLENLI